MNRYLRKGFTLAELLIVIAIIGVLSSMMMIASSESMRTTKAGNIVSTLRNFASAAMTFYTDSIDYFTQNPNTKTNLKPYVKKYMYNGGNSVQDDDRYIVSNDNGTWWVGYNIGNDSDSSGIKTRLQNRAQSSGLMGLTAKGADGKYSYYQSSNGTVWLLIRENNK